MQGSWDQSGNPYRITGNLSIALGSSLVVSEGVEVIFNGTFRIDVAGRILATGTALAPVTFTAQDTLNGWSGIRFLNSGSIQNLPSGFTHTQFSYGKAIWGTGGADPLNYGGAVWASAAGLLTFTNCTFLRCKSAQDGSAIYAKDGTNIQMTGCTIKSCESGFFGGVFVKQGNANIIDCSFETNSAVTFGAAIYLYECPQANVISCRVLDNVAGAVAGIYCFDSPLKVINSLFASNSTTMGQGGGMGVIYGTLTVTSCSFANNGSALGGGAFWLNSLDSDAQITNCIFWNNLPTPISTTSCSYILSYCSTQSQEGDATNIFGDPQFVSGAEGDFRLTASSGCIDAGTPETTGLLLPDLDLSGLDRVVDGNGDGTPRIDIGCYEWQEPVTTGILQGIVLDQSAVPVTGASVNVADQTVLTDAEGFFSFELSPGTYSLSVSAAGFEDFTLDNIQIQAGQTTTVSIELTLIVSSDDELAPQLPGLTASPNPFSASTVLRWTLKQPRMLEIFNLRGQLLTSCRLDAGNQNSWTWNGLDRHGLKLPSGIYFGRVSGKNASQTIKLLLRN